MSKVRRIRFQGEPALELTTRGLRIVAITGRGPRLAFFGRPGGENLLFWAPGKHRRGEWNLHGGHRLWTTRPGADEGEETYRPDNAACTVELTKSGFTVTAAVDTETKLQRSVTVRAVGADRLHLTHTVHNTSDMLWCGGLWTLTCTKPAAEGDTYLVPLGDGSGWDYATIVSFRVWGGGHGGVGFDDPQFSTTRDQFLLRPAGRENKRMLKADPGIMAWHSPSRGVVFAKHAAYQPQGHYPLATNAAFYVGPENFMVEMEMMGPFTTLKPGAKLTHEETWALGAAGSRPPTNAQLRRLVGV